MVDMGVTSPRVAWAGLRQVSLAAVQALLMWVAMLLLTHVVAVVAADSSVVVAGRGRAAGEGRISSPVTHLL
jgi:hypothetical protein